MAKIEIGSLRQWVKYLSHLLVHVKFLKVTKKVPEEESPVAHQEPVKMYIFEYKSIYSISLFLMHTNVFSFIGKCIVLPSADANVYICKFCFTE